MSTANQPAQDRALVGTRFRTYKSSTNKLASWLATTASLEIGHCSLPMQAKDGHTHGLTIAQFSQLTDLIVSATPRLEVPLDIVSASEKAYRFRQECAIILQGTDVESDKRHQYVVSVIGEVFQKLSRHSRPVQQSSEPRIGLKKENNDVVPSFELLDIEEMESSADESSKIEAANQLKKKNRNKKKKMLKQKKKAREQGKHAYLLDEEEDPYFVLMCLLSDLKSMRDYVKEIWKEYKDGKADLITVSLTTNATFDIIRTYEDDFPAIKTLLSDYSQAVKLILSRNLTETDEGLALFFNPCTTLSGVDMAEIQTVGLSLSTIPQVAELIFSNAYYFLSGPRHVIVQKKQTSWSFSWSTEIGKWQDMQTIDESIDPFGKYKSEKSGEEINLVQRFKEDIQILARFAKYVYISGGEDKDFFRSTPDHFTLQWRNEFAKTGDKTVSLAQAFGAQIYLDINHALREDVSRGSFDLYKGASSVVNSILAWKFSTPQDMIDGHAEFQKAEANLGLTCASLCEGLIFEMKSLLKCGEKISKTGEISDDAIKEALTAFPLLEINPMLCGVVLFEAVHALRDEGTYSSHFAGFLKFAGQIYYGCKLQRNFWKSATDLDKNGVIFKRMINRRWKDSLEWKDMDYLFDLLGVETFFDGAIPRSNNDLAEYYGPLEDLLITSKWWKEREHKVYDDHFGPILTAPTLEEDGTARQFKFEKLIYNFEPVLVTHQLYYSKYFRFPNQDLDKTPVYDWTLETLQILLESHLKAKQSRIDSKQGKGKKKATIALLKDDKDGTYRKSLFFEHSKKFFKVKVEHFVLTFCLYILPAFIS